MKCPRCETEMEQTNIRELGLTPNAHLCAACQGYWIGTDELKDIESKVERTFVEFRMIPSKADQMKVMHCPQCPDKKEMTKVVSERDKKVVMDVCSSCHNIWLDGGEMKAIQEESLPALLSECMRWSRKA